MEYIAHSQPYYPNVQANVQSIDLNIAKPMLHDSLHEASQTLVEKLQQSDLIMYLLQPHHDAAQALNNLRSMLSLPGMSAQVNRSDRFGWKPLDYAVRAFPEAMEVLLQAGASANSKGFGPSRNASEPRYSHGGQTGRKRSSET